MLGIMASQISGHLATVPAAPTIGTVTITSSTVVSIPFTAGSNGGATITSYVASCSPSISLTVSPGTTSPLTVTGAFVKNTSYTFTIAAVNSVGTGAYSSSSNSILPNPYVVGDTGPGGGTVFYDAGSVQSWGRYIEAANWTDASYVWSGNTTVSIGTTSVNIGTGMTNTTAMVAQDSTASRAATICRAYTSNGKTDWFLPSKNELFQMYVQRAVISMTTNGYWSSSEFDATNAWEESMSSGSQGSVGKINAAYVRAVRYI